MAVDAGHGEAAVFRAVNVELLLQPVHLFASQTSEAKHTNLISNMFPAATLASIERILQLVSQQVAHVANALCHAFAFIQPLLLELRIR